MQEEKSACDSATSYQKNLVRINHFLLEEVLNYCNILLTLAAVPSLPAPSQSAFLLSFSVPQDDVS